MKLTVDMVPMNPDGSLDIESWTYRAIRAQQQVCINGDQALLFERLILTPMIWAIFNDSKIEEGYSPTRYSQACALLLQEVPDHKLTWSQLRDQFRQQDYPKLRRMLERTRYYRALFECKPGGLRSAWKQFFVASGCGTAEEAEQPSDLKTLFMLHLSIGPRVDKVQNFSPKRRRTSDDLAETQFVAAVSQPLVDFMRELTELFREFAQLDPQDLQRDLAWILAQLRSRLESRDDPEEPYADEGVGTDEEVRILEPAFVVDFESDQKPLK